MSISPTVRRSFSGATCSALNRAIFGVDVTSEGCAGPIELDHVREDIGGKRYDDPAHLLPFCAWHHRLSQEWRSDSKAHRAIEREYLARKYPEAWS